MSSIPLIARAEGFADRTAVVDQDGSHTYEWLDTRSRLRATQLLAGRPDLEEARVAYLMEPGLDHVATQWAIWRAGGVAVPLCPDHPEPELARAVDDCGASILLATRELDERLRPLAETRELPYRAVGASGYDIQPVLPLLTPEERVRAEPADAPLEPPVVDLDRRALILYTSGTTGRPKGVVSTHANLDAQIRALHEAWAWTPEDRILHVLPLHHTHGIVNALCCALYAGAAVEFAPFEPAAVWDRLASGEISVFMAVPTIYAKLLRARAEADDFTRRRWSRGARGLRLAVSGSAALPATIFEEWEEVTDRPLLERYGMTETGMGLSNPYRGERRAGTVGQPLPGVEIRLVSPEDGRILAEGTRPPDPGASGEIQVRGPGVFREYWGLPEETAAAFDDGWFRTGDEATVTDGYYRILGRRSVDILKSGGYKISAVEIEEMLRSHPAVRDCAVVGLPDEEWGQRVAAAVVPEPGAWFVPDLVPAGEEGRDERARAVSAVLDPWVRERLAAYKVPRAWLCVDELPRNAMGKVRKPAVRELFGEPGEEGRP